jgi:hypothetical protein
VSERQTIIIHVMSHLLQNPSLLRGKRFQGDDAQNTSLMYQVFEACEVLADLILQCGHKSEFHMCKLKGGADGRRHTRKRGQGVSGQTSYDRTARRRTSRGPDQGLRTRPGTRTTARTLRQVGACRTTSRAEGRAYHCRSSQHGKTAFHEETGQLFRACCSPQAEGSRVGVKLYVMHVDRDYLAFTHVVVMANDIVEAREKVLDFPGCANLDPDREIHLGRILCTPTDWHATQGLTVKQMCSRCWRTSSTA